MTKREGVVSAWVGQFPSEATLFDYVAKSYPGDGAARSDFLSHVPIGSYDEDLSEANFLGSSVDVRAAISPHSYATSFQDRLEADLKGAGKPNSLYLIYDHDASKVQGAPASPLRFLGVYPYVKSV